MEKIIVNGGKALEGEIRVSGSKNAALPLIFAALLIDGEVTLRNVPDIGDVRVALELLSDFGAEISFAEGVLRINSSKVKFTPQNPRLSGKIRASTYLVGACLSRFGVAEIPASGGCNFSHRPIDFHINAAKSFGAVVEESNYLKGKCNSTVVAENTPAEDDLYYPSKSEKYLIAEQLRGAKITLPKPSVGASINALLMAAGADGDSEILGFAKEPHVLSVIDFLRAAGAEIQLENEKIKVHPAPLHPVDFTVIGDMIEAGTYLTAALISGGKIKVTGIDPRELSAYLDTVKMLGFIPEIGHNSICIDSKNRPSFTSQKSLCSTSFDSKKRNFSGNKISVSAAPYPAFPTDLQPIAAPLIAKESGGEIRDFVFPERFGYLKTLAAFGIKSTVESSAQNAKIHEENQKEYTKKLENNCAKIEKSRLKSGSAIAPDLRGGMACLLAALGAKGHSEIYSPEIILRGYDKLTEKLASLGADVKVVKM